MSLRSKPLPAFVLGLACLLSACGKDDEAGKPPQGRGGMQAPVVVVDTAREMPWSDSLHALGTVQAREAVTVTAKVSEIVQRVHFESGQQVQRGAPLVTLSGQQQQAALASAEATLKEAEQLYARQSALAEQQLIARASLDSQRAARDAARAQVAQIRANLADRVIRAPFAGVLGIRQVSPGALVTPGTAIATLDDIARVFVDFPVPEAQLAQAAPGHRIVGTVAAWPDMRFDGEVRTIDARIDATSRAAKVRADFPNPDGRLRPGMLVNVEVRQAHRPALVVPELAVVQVGRDSFVYRVKADSTVEQVPVKVGARDEGKAEIVEGIKAGEKIVVEGMGKLRPGMKVRASAAGAPAAASGG